MTPTELYAAVLSLWGEDRRPELARFLERSGMRYMRQTF